MKALILLATLVSAPNAERNGDDDAMNQTKVKATVQALFDAMRSADSTRLRTLFTDNAQLKTVQALPNSASAQAKPKAAVLKEESVEAFIRAVGTPRKEVWDERIFDVEVKIDGELAMVWTKYEFYVDTTFSHCGVNLFQLLKQSDGWKIFSVTDTRRKSPCERRLDAHK
ncbi:MAG: nuclear transport factor 2 family protein [Chloroherpetonaceae bacterium]